MSEVADINSPRNRATFWEYAIEAGGSVLNHTRYATFQDAYFECLVRNNIDRERCGRVLVKRRVVCRKVVFGEWQEVTSDRKRQRKRAAK